MRGSVYEKYLASGLKKDLLLPEHRVSVNEEKEVFTKFVEETGVDFEIVRKA